METVRSRGAQLLQGLGWGKRLPKPKAVAVALQLMGVMLESGVPLSQVFGALEHQVEDDALRLVLSDVDYKVTRMGWKLSLAMNEHPQVFPPYTVMFVHAGEMGGSVFSRLKRAGEVMERELDLRNQVKSALTGPAVTLSVACTVLLLAVKFVMPRFIDMYDGMKLELPAITKIVMAIVAVVNHPAFFVSLAALLLVLHWQRQRLMQWAFVRAVRTPVLSRWVGILLGAQFCDVLASLLGEGVPLVRAVKMLGETSPFELHRQRLREVHRRLVEEGDFATSIQTVEYFPSMLTTVAMVGQESGSLDVLVNSLKEILEQEVDTTIGSIVTLVEPCMICLMGMITAFFFVGLFMPVYGMLHNLGG